MEPSSGCRLTAIFILTTSLYSAICGELHLTILNNVLLNHGVGGSRKLQSFLEERDIELRHHDPRIAELAVDEFNASSLHARTSGYTRPLLVPSAFSVHCRRHSAQKK